MKFYILYESRKEYPWQVLDEHWLTRGVFKTKDEAIGYVKSLGGEWV